jgi:hypothetical protein
MISADGPVENRRPQSDRRAILKGSVAMVGGCTLEAMLPASAGAKDRLGRSLICIDRRRERRRGSYHGIGQCRQLHSQRGGADARALAEIVSDTRIAILFGGTQASVKVNSKRR